MNSRARTAAGSPTAPASRPRSGLLVGFLIWVLIVLMIVPDGFTYQYTAGAIIPTEGSAGSRAIWLALLIGGLVLPLSRSGEALRLLKQINPFFLAFACLALASCLWSIEPGFTLRRFMRVITNLGLSMSFAMIAWHGTRFQDVLRPILTLLLVGSVIFVMAAPDLAIETSTQASLLGAWRGLATQKNGLGSLSAIALIFWLHALLSKERPSWVALLGMALSATCLINSRSSTSIMNAAFSCVLMFFFMNTPRGLRRYLPYLIVLFVVTILLYSLAVLNLIPGSNMLLTPITALSGKDMTFSGRTNIWAILNQHIALRPYLGSGYGAYWVELPTSPSAEMTARLYFYPTEAHNGYLDVINDLGAVGAIILIAYLVNYLRQGLRLLKSMPTQGILYLTLLFDQLIVNLTESRWLNCLTCEFTIMTIATVCLARSLMERQKQSKSLPSKPVPTPSKPRSAGLRLGPVPRRTL